MFSSALRLTSKSGGGDNWRLVSGVGVREWWGLWRGDAFRRTRWHGGGWVMRATGRCERRTSRGSGLRLKAGTTLEGWWWAGSNGRWAPGFWPPPRPFWWLTAVGASARPPVGYWSCCSGLAEGPSTPPAIRHTHKLGERECERGPSAKIDFVINPPDKVYAHHARNYPQTSLRQTRQLCESEIRKV